jgi:hypothetical protein
LDAEDFKGAMSNAEFSLKIYKEIRSSNPELFSDKVSELELMIKEINKTITTGGDFYFSTAGKYFDSGDYEKAKEYAEKAKESYIEMGDEDSVSSCNSMIRNSEMYINRNSIILKIIYAVGTVIVICIIFIIYRKYREGHRHQFDPASDLTIGGTIKIPINSSGFSEVTNYSEIPEEAIEPYTEKSIHDLIAQGKTIVKCNECGAYYNKKILEYYKMNCARFGCKNSTL